MSSLLTFKNCINVYTQAQTHADSDLYILGEEEHNFIYKYSCSNTEVWKFIYFLFVQTFVRLFRLRHYSGNVSFIPAPGYEEYGEPISVDNEKESILQDTGINGTEEMKLKTSNCLGALSSSENYKWKSIDGQFIIVWLHNVPWGSQDIMPAPHAEVSLYIWN